MSVKNLSSFYLRSIRLIVSLHPPKPWALFFINFFRSFVTHFSSYICYFYFSFLTIERTLRPHRRFVGMSVVTNVRWVIFMIYSWIERWLDHTDDRSRKELDFSSRTLFSAIPQMKGRRSLSIVYVHSSAPYQSSQALDFFLNFKSSPWASNLPPMIDAFVTQKSERLVSSFSSSDLIDNRDIYPSMYVLQSSAPCILLSEISSRKLKVCMYVWERLHGLVNRERVERIFYMESTDEFSRHIATKHPTRKEYPNLKSNHIQMWINILPYFYETRTKGKKKGIYSKIFLLLASKTHTPPTRIEPIQALPKNR